MPSHSQCSRNRSDHPSLRRRRLVAALCLTTGIALSACGPAHKGQLTVEPVNASAEASASSSATPSKKPSPTATKSPSTPSPSATAWTAPNVTITNEDTSVWAHDDERIKKDSAGPNGTIDGYTVNANPACFGFISSEAEEVLQPPGSRRRYSVSSSPQASAVNLLRLSDNTRTDLGGGHPRRQRNLPRL